jgi:hypothetical protein
VRASFRGRQNTDDHPNIVHGAIHRPTLGKERDMSPRYALPPRQRVGTTPAVAVAEPPRTRSEWIPNLHGEDGTYRDLARALSLSISARTNSSPLQARSRPVIDRAAVSSLP